MSDIKKDSIRSTDDFFLMGIFHAFDHVEPDIIDLNQFLDGRFKGTAIYQNADRLPFLRDVKVTCGDKTIDISKFMKSFYQMRDKVFETIRQEKKKTKNKETGQDESKKNESD